MQGKILFYFLIFFSIIAYQLSWWESTAHGEQLAVAHASRSKSFSKKSQIISSAGGKKKNLLFLLFFFFCQWKLPPTCDKTAAAVTALARLLGSNNRSEPAASFCLGSPSWFLITSCCSRSRFSTPYHSSVCSSWKIQFPRKGRKIKIREASVS